MQTEAKSDGAAAGRYIPRIGGRTRSPKAAPLPSGHSRDILMPGVEIGPDDDV
jgi:hypothetical protein